FITEVMTPKLASAASIAGLTPGRRTISFSGAAGGTGPSSAPSSSAIFLGSGVTHSTTQSASRLMPAAASHGTVNAAASSSRPENSGPNTDGPRIAPNTEPNST